MDPKTARLILVTAHQAAYELSALKHSGWPDIKRLMRQYGRNTGVSMADVEAARKMTFGELVELAAGAPPVAEPVV